MTKSTPRILVIGGMNMDILGTSAVPYTPGDSLPGSIQHRPGGVARNIAAFLRTLSAKVELLCPLGNDALANQLRTACSELGIGLRYAVQTSEPTPTYLAIHDEEGEVVCAINDMRAMAWLKPGALAEHIPNLNTFDACVLDANLTSETLVYLAERLTIPMIADPVSAVKSTRLLPILKKLSAIKPNLLEAQALTGQQEVSDAAVHLLNLGVKQVFISLGKEGLYYADAHKHGKFAATLFPGVAKTGAGDAMTAGLAVGIAQGLSITDIAEKGIQASAIFLESTRKVD